MRANKKTLLAVKFYLSEEQEYWDKEQVIADTISKTCLLKDKRFGDVAADECSVVWGTVKDGDDICNLQDFIDSFMDCFIEKILDVLDSFVDEDISCYFEKEF